MNPADDSLGCCLLLPARQPPLVPSELSTRLQFDGPDCLVINANEYQGSAWAGVSRLIEQIFIGIRRSGPSELIEKYNYVLHMALPQYRGEIPLKGGSLTDLAHGSEKTRNFPLNRAYRIVHGLVDLTIDWRVSSGSTRTWLILVEEFSAAQHLARRFFLELARRGSIRADLRVFVRGHGRFGESDLSSNCLQAIDCVLTAPPATVANLTRRIESDKQANELLQSFTTFEAVELHYKQLLAYYQSRSNGLAAARAALSALGVCNHFGYYAEANALVNQILPYFDELVKDSDENRWNYAGNIFQSYLGLDDIAKATEAVERLAEPRLTNPLFRAKMKYILGIIHLRYKKPAQLDIAEIHLAEAAELIQTAKPNLDPQEFAFQKVFIDNGLAYLRVKQGRTPEAIELCQRGYDLLTEELGTDAHRLHRSVLQYNMAQVYNIMGDLKRALTHYEQARAMDPNYSEYYNEMANLYQRQNKFEQALTYYDRAITLSPPYPEVHFNKCVCLARMDRWREAYESCEKSLDLDPMQVEAWLLRAEICDHLGLIDEAIETYSEALSIAGDNVAARVNKAALLSEKGLFPEALKEIEYAIAANCNDPSLYENRAFLHKEMGILDLYERDRRAAELIRSGEAVVHTGSQSPEHAGRSNAASSVGSTWASRSWIQP